MYQYHQPAHTAWNLALGGYQLQEPQQSYLLPSQWLQQPQATTITTVTTSGDRPSETPKPKVTPKNLTDLLRVDELFRRHDAIVARNFFLVIGALALLVALLVILFVMWGCHMFRDSRVHLDARSVRETIIIAVLIAGTIYVGLWGVFCMVLKTVLKKFSSIKDSIDDKKVVTCLRDLKAVFDPTFSIHASVSMNRVAYWLCSFFMVVQSAFVFFTLVTCVFHHNGMSVRTYMAQTLDNRQIIVISSAVFLTFLGVVVMHVGLRKGATLFPCRDADFKNDNNVDCEAVLSQGYKVFQICSGLVFVILGGLFCLSVWALRMNEFTAHFFFPLASCLGGICLWTVCHTGVSSGVAALEKRDKRTDKMEEQEHLLGQDLQSTQHGWTRQPSMLNLQRGNTMVQQGNGVSNAPSLDLSATSGARTREVLSQLKTNMGFYLDLKTLSEIRRVGSQFLFSGMIVMLSFICAGGMLVSFVIYCDTQIRPAMVQWEDGASTTYHPFEIHENMKFISLFLVIVLLHFCSVALQLVIQRNHREVGDIAEDLDDLFIHACQEDKEKSSQYIEIKYESNSGVLPAAQPTVVPAQPGPTVVVGQPQPQMTATEYVLNEYNQYGTLNLR